ncbi:MAG: acyltransferase family protein [Deltaproteobacteria bacterium]|nr:acyltransferase family protein [Deltaproteobacteria bacterium]
MTEQERFHSLDSVRGLALLLGIVVHSTLSFYSPIPKMDNSPSTTLSVCYYVIHIFRMSVFYFIAGFFAHMVFHRMGGIAFIIDRARRIGIPLLAGAFILVPMTVASVYWGMLGSSWSNAFFNVLKGQFHSHINWSYLWFLYYLCIFYVLTLALYWVFVRTIDRTGSLRLFVDKMTALAVRSNCVPLLLATPIFLQLYFSNNWNPWMGLMTPDLTFIPNPAAIIGYGTAFGFGWILNRQTQLLYEWKKHWMLYLVIAIALTVFCLSQVGLKPVFFGTQIAGWSRFGYAVAYTMAIWFWTFGIIGAALRFCSEYNTHRRYMADASYWLYLMHLPVIFPLQVIMAGLPLHWSIKFTLIVAATTALGLVSYRYLVRFTFIGSLLNGRRYPRTKKHAEKSDTQPISGVIAFSPPLPKMIGNDTLTEYANC